MHRSRQRVICLACATSVALGVLNAEVAAAEIYGYTDSDGVLHLGTSAHSTDYQLLAKSPGAERPGVTSSSGPTQAGVPVLSSRAAIPFQSHIRTAARRHNIDEALLMAVIATESGYNPAAVSPRGAVGLMQLMPATARLHSVVDTRDPLQNILGGARHLRQMLDLFGQDLTLALAAYNAGENAVLRHGRTVPPYRETQRYVPTVLALYRQYAGCASPPCTDAGRVRF